MKDIQPSFTVGEALLKDRVWAFLGFAPEYISRARTVNFPSNINASPLVFNDPQLFNRDQQTYYGNGRIDIRATNKLNVFASWLYQYQRESGEDLPYADSNNALYNPFATSPLIAYEHGYGFSAPDTTLNIGADYTITPRLVSTSRFGYFFENSHNSASPRTEPFICGKPAGWDRPAATKLAVRTRTTPSGMLTSISRLTRTLPGSRLDGWERIASRVVTR